MSSIDCEDVLRELELYLDGELRDDACSEIREHLGACGSCMDRTEFQRRLRALLSQKCGCDQVPRELQERVRALLRGPGSS